jgi:SpoVK/Ycf46/Vps4 family AAA+-type ATPase
MNQDLLIRLFRSIEGDRDDDIVKIAGKIIEDEKQKGHSKLANRLQELLDKNIDAHLSFKKELKTLLPVGTHIPTDKRNKFPLATVIPREELRHEMVLSNDVETQINRIEKEFGARERLAHFGLKPRKKILFYGSPGCGKSMSAERIAWHIGLPFLKVRFEAIISSYLGESATNLKALFESIRNYPCVLLLDEFDFIAKSRSNGQDVGEMHRVVNILLNLLEDYDAPGILIATTNLQGSLDTALFRRFDDIIEIPKPSKLEILKLLKATLSSIKTSKNVNWQKIADKMNGFSAALVVKVANDAAKTAILENKNIIEQAHLLSAFEENFNYNK